MIEEVSTFSINIFYVINLLAGEVLGDDWALFFTFLVNIIQGFLLALEKL